MADACLNWFKLFLRAFLTMRNNVYKNRENSIIHISINVFLWKF